MAKKKNRLPGMKRPGKPGGAFEFFGPSAERDFAIEQGLGEDAFGSLMLLASVDDPANPRCPGPVVVHEDGTIECEGGCAGIRFAYHGPGSTVSCEVHGPSSSWRCIGCEA
jgi:hypothetical protein